MEADVLCRAEALPFSSGCFDAVLLTEVLEHTVQPFLALAECSRVIGASGHVILSVPFIYPLHDWPHDYWRFTRFGLEALCRQAGLRPVYIHTKGGVGATVMSLTIQLAVRATDGITKLFGFSRPIRQLPAVRWLLVMPQRLFLLLAGGLRLPEALQRTSEWMTPGFFVVATKASAPPGDNLIEVSTSDSQSGFEDGV
jgi:SAM-dependent methyltransferase